jgi:hypothetical protein
VKKIHSFLLLNCLLLAIIGYHFIYQYGISEAKEEMQEMIRNRIHTENLVTLEFSPSELSSLQWENDHEFFYHDRMYDLESRQEKNGRVILSCIRDEKESQLANAYREANNRNKGQNGPVEELARLLFTPFIQVSQQLPSAFSTDYRFIFPSYKESLIWTPSELATPPPREIA